MKTMLIVISMACLTGCSVFYHAIPGRRMSVRIINTGCTPTTGYEIGGHSFSGLEPGDSTGFQLFKRLNYAEGIFAIIDSLKTGIVIPDCGHCIIATRKKVTIKLKIIYEHQYEYPLLALDGFDFN